MNLNSDKGINRNRMEKMLLKSYNDKIISSNDSVLNYKKDYVFNISKNMRKNESISSSLFKSVGYNSFTYNKSLTLPLNHCKILLGNDYNNAIKIRQTII